MLADEWGETIIPAPEEAAHPTGCEGCKNAGDRIDALTTQVANLTVNIMAVEERMAHVIGGLNAVGEQNNWIVENAGKVFTAFEQMRGQFANGGLMGMMKGIKSE